MKPGRPRKFRRICFSPRTRYFKPRGIPLHMLDEVVLSFEEMESLRLYYELELEQIDCAKKMKISQPTFHRHLNSAQQKIASALLSGKAIKIVDKK
jgi:predicted DNA-binding protein (UPF0251 family)